MADKDFAINLKKKYPLKSFRAATDLLNKEVLEKDIYGTGKKRKFI